MPIFAATGTSEAATHSHWLAGLITVALVVLVIAMAGYAAKCWLFPFTSCPHGNAHRAWRCRHCQGTGRRLRAGRRLLNHLRDIRR